MAALSSRDARARCCFVTTRASTIATLQRLNDNRVKLDFPRGLRQRVGDKSEPREHPQHKNTLLRRGAAKTAQKVHRLQFAEHPLRFGLAERRPPIDKVVEEFPCEMPPKPTDEIRPTARRESVPKRWCRRPRRIRSRRHALECRSPGAALLQYKSITRYACAAALFVLDRQPPARKFQLLCGR